MLGLSQHSPAFPEKRTFCLVSPRPQDAGFSIEHKPKILNTMNKGIVIYDIVFAVLFAALGAGASYGVVFKGAYWHILTVAIAVAMFVALVRDAKKERSHDYTAV